jgi:hypothetical protein
VHVAFGLRAHSGWAALVALGEEGSELAVVARRRVELIAPADAHWSKQPYHAAEGLDPSDARDVVKRGIDAARQIAVHALRSTVADLSGKERRVVACAVLTGDPMPAWTVDQILAVHFRMHKAEGELFREALMRAAGACNLRLVPIPEKRLDEQAATTLGASAPLLRARIGALAKAVGTPWGKDQKDAALAAWVALRS